MTYWCPICTAHRNKDEYKGEDFGSVFFPDSVLVCEVCMKNHEGNPWFNNELIDFEKKAQPHLKCAITHLAGVKQEQEQLEYGENMYLIFEENKKFYDEVNRLEKMSIDFDKPSSNWAEVLYRIAWRQGERFVGERVSWISTSNKRVIQAHIVSIDTEKHQVKIRALEDENYRVKDKDGILRKGGDKIVGLFHLLPPKTTGKNVYKKQVVCHNCSRMFLKISIGTEDYKHKLCSRCKYK